MTGFGKSRTYRFSANRGADAGGGIFIMLDPATSFRHRCVLMRPFPHIVATLHTSRKNARPMRIILSHPASMTSWATKTNNHPRLASLPVRKGKTSISSKSSSVSSADEQRRAPRATRSVNRPKSSTWIRARDRLRTGERDVSPPRRVTLQRSCGRSVRSGEACARR